MPALPPGLAIGRGAFSGPVIGGYAMFPYGPVTVAANGTDIIPIGFIAPCDLRLQAISYVLRTANTGTGHTLTFSKHASAFQTSGATALITTTPIDLDANLSGQVLPSGESGGLTGITLVTAARNITKGECVFAVVTTDAAQAATDLSVLFVCTIVGFAQAESIRD